VQIPITGKFWSVDVGNLVTWAFVIGGWLWARSKSEAVILSRLKSSEAWQEKHDAEAEERDKLIKKMEENVMRLTLIAEISEKRLHRAEGQR
jgi:hypothetical protein